LLQIEQPRDQSRRTALLDLGFRPFFLGGLALGLVSMLLWTLQYQLGWNLPVWPSPGLAHAHELVFGYSFAVAAGFLLTAIHNWTNLWTLHGMPLLLLVASWLLARLLWLSGAQQWWPAAALDLLFALSLVLACSWPLLRARQWYQLWLILILLLIGSANAAFYLHPQQEWAAVHAGLFGILLLIFVMARRVVPFFIERAVEGNPRLPNRPRVDLMILLLYLAFAVLSVGQSWPQLTGLLSLLLVTLLTWRLLDWHHPGIWSRPLLWVLWLGLAWINFGFLLTGLASWLPVSPLLALHAWTVGGVGLMTLGMIARVSLGHTGRSVFAPPAVVTPVFLAILVAAVARVLLPWLLPQWYGAWVLAAQLAWMLGFALLLWHYAPMLVRPRLDGRRG